MCNWAVPARHCLRPSASRMIGIRPLSVTPFPACGASGYGLTCGGGVSYVQAELTHTTVIPALGLYAQTDNTDDLLGNVGFGVGYRLYTSRHVRLQATRGL